LPFFCLFLSPTRFSLQQFLGLSFFLANLFFLEIVALFQHVVPSQVGIWPVRTEFPPPLDALHLLWSCPTVGPNWEQCGSVPSEQELRFGSVSFSKNLPWTNRPTYPSKPFPLFCLLLTRSFSTLFSDSFFFSGSFFFSSFVSSFEEWFFFSLFPPLREVSFLSFIRDLPFSPLFQVSHSLHETQLSPSQILFLSFTGCSDLM